MMVGVEAIVAGEAAFRVQSHIRFSPLSEQSVPSDEDEHEWLSCVMDNQDRGNDIFETLPQRQGPISFSPLCCDSPLSPGVRIPTPNFTPNITPLVKTDAGSNAKSCGRKTNNRGCIFPRSMVSIQSVSSQDANKSSKLYAEDSLTPLNPQQSLGVQSTKSCSKSVSRKCALNYDHAPSSTPRPLSRATSSSIPSSRQEVCPSY